MSDNKQCTKCDKSKNWEQCPLRMQDGRSFGDAVYGSRCDKQYQGQLDMQFNSSYEYRLFLQRNAEALMKKNAQKAFTLV
jgi:hypothetical protein